MKDLTLTDATFDSNGYWVKPIPEYYRLSARDVDLFDQNGYDLTDIEKIFALLNNNKAKTHRDHRFALKQDWLIQISSKDEGALLNHSLLFERKGYSGEALEQLQRWAQDLPLLNKITSIRPKWGLDFSMDWVDRKGNAFEILHWEYDGFNHDEILAVKQQFETTVLNIDWDDAGIQLLKRKDQWHHLDFFSQSDWKCNFFGVEKERFKMIIWK